MRNYFLKLLLASTSFILATVFLSAQPASEAFAGGEITMEYVGNPAAPCDGPQAYNFTLKFYRDCTPLGLQLTKSIYLYSKSNNNLVIQIGLSQTQTRGQIANLCLKGNPVCTAGQWYTTSNPVNIPFPADDWKLIYGTIPMGNIANGFVGRNYQSPATLNIETGQTFFLLTTLKNLVICGEVEGVLESDLTTTIRRKNAPYNTSARWITPDIVETFCVGQSYNYKLPVVDDDEFIIDGNLNNSTFDTLVIKDSLSYEITSAFRRNAFSVKYLTNEGYGPSSPFPSTTPITFDEKEGILSFKPSLAGGQGGFIAVVAFNVIEWRKYFYVDSTCFNLAGCPPAIKTPVIRSKIARINTTRRQMRFVFDTQCNKRLPDFTSTEYNAPEEAWEFECGATELEFTMTQPMLLRTALEDPKWLSMYRGKPGQPRDDNAIGIDRIEPLNSTPLQEFTRFRVYLYEPIGPGNYTLFPKPNKQLTGLKNRCGFELSEGSVLIPVYVNTDYIYDFKADVKEFCYPADIPFEVDALQGQEKLRRVASLYTWRFIEFDPNTVRDSIYPPKSTYSISVDTNIQGDLEFPAGTWEVGLGLDFGYTYNDSMYEAYCYDTDNFEVIFYQNDPVEIPNYDLCADEPWPQIDLDTMTLFHDAINYRWTYFNPNKPAGEEWVIVGGNSNSGKKNSIFNVGSIGSGLGKPYIITSEVELENGKCFERDTFIVLKDLVRVNIDFGRDTIICPGFEYRLTNTTSYLLPDSMSYQWYLNDELLPDEDTSFIQISDSGMYKLEVTKVTENSMCMGVDSVLVNVADSLGPPEPKCTQVTFKDGDIEQTFYIPPSKGAEDFQVREIDPLGNEGEWIKTNSGALDHILRGQQLKLEARGVNTEVDEDAPCRYGPIGIAAACRAIVKPVNIFTPNGDGVNELLRFDLLEVYPGSPLKIFNRWGEMIYDTNNYLNDWDGENYKDGTYFYVLEINDEGQGILKGTFTILR